MLCKNQLVSRTSVWSGEELTKVNERKANFSYSSMMQLAARRREEMGRDKSIFKDFEVCLTQVKR